MRPFDRLEFMPMSETPETEPESSEGDETPVQAPANSFNAWTIGVIAVVVIVVLALVVSYVRSGDDGDKVDTGLLNRRVGVEEFLSIAAQIDQTIYWAGPIAGYEYSIVPRPDGLVVHYLPPSIPGTTNGGNDIQVGSYASPDPVAQTTGGADDPNDQLVELGGGSVLLVPSEFEKSVYVGFNGAPVQVEVFHPTAGEAANLVTSGRVAKV
jgi:hypothetical protein